MSMILWQNCEVKEVYLSRIMLDSTKPKTMLALASPNLFHGAIESAASDERARKLWRVDMLHGVRCLLILSENKTDWSSVAEQFGLPDKPVETKAYDTLLARISNGSKWQFRLRANPTIAIKQGGARGKVLAHTTTDYQMKWLTDRAESHGFLLKPEEYLVTENKWYSFRKGNAHRVHMLAVTFEGLLTVTDAALFRRMLTEGIGREKAYGMGLLTVTSPRN